MIVYCSNNKAYIVVTYIIKWSSILFNCQKKKKNIQVHNFICSLKFQKQNIILGCMEYF